MISIGWHSWILLILSIASLLQFALDWSGGEHRPEPIIPAIVITLFLWSL